MTVTIRSDAGLEVDHHVPQDRHLLVHTGDHAEAGDPLIEGPLDPKDILSIKGEEALLQLPHRQRCRTSTAPRACPSTTSTSR